MPVLERRFVLIVLVHVGSLLLRSLLCCRPLLGRWLLVRILVLVLVVALVQLLDLRETGVLGCDAGLVAPHQQICTLIGLKPTIVRNLHRHTSTLLTLSRRTVPERRTQLH